MWTPISICKRCAVAALSKFSAGVALFKFRGGSALCKFSAGIALAALLCCLPGCNRTGGEDASLLTHLNPCLADGRSPVKALSHLRLMEKQVFEKSRIRKGSWNLGSAVVQNREGTGQDAKGVIVQRRHNTVGAVGAIRIFYKSTFRAWRHHIFELDLILPSSGHARLCWRRTDEARSETHWVDAELEGKTSVQTLRFAPGTSEEWYGETESLWIEPEWENEKAVQVQLLEVRVLEAGFQPGHEPLDLDQGDGGLVELMGETRRTWPTDFEVPLLAPCTVGKASVFLSSVALLQGQECAAAFFTLHGREPGEDWVELKRERITPDMGWHAFKADLAPLGKGEAELRMTVLRPASEGKVTTVDASRAPQRGGCLWGEPLVIHDGPRTRRPSVVLITLDTTRSDHVGDPKVTPNLCNLAEEGIYFENAWTGCNSTTPSHASILTGIHVVEHGALDNRTVLPEGNTTLAEMFRHAGYQTAGAVSVRHLQAGAGFGQGFDRFRQASRDSNVNGALTVEPVLEWLRAWGREGDRPFFLWLHLFDPHIPYGPPGDFARDHAKRMGFQPPPTRADPATIPQIDEEIPVHLAWLEGITSHEHAKYLYSAGVSYADDLVGRVMDTLKEAGLDENTVFWVTADHGESLNEHDIWYDHAGLFSESLQVPMILRLPGGPAGQRVAGTVCNLDIVPTLSALCGLEAQPGLRGVDLEETIRTGGDRSRRLWFEYPNLIQIGFRDGAHHFITTPGDGLRYGMTVEMAEGRRIAGYTEIPQGASFLFDVDKDPGMLEDRAEAESKTVEALGKQVKQWQKNLFQGDVIRRNLSKEDEELLEALGYGK